MWNDIEKFIENYEAFLIVGHVHPDGDSIGSQMALKLFLEDRDKTAVVANASKTPEALAFLDPDGEIVECPDGPPPELLENVDAVFVLDLNNWDQLATLARPIEQSSLPRVCIDHHENADLDFADTIISDTSAAATGILIFELITALGGKLTRSIVDALYTAIITDTGTFRFSNTDARTFTTAAKLAENGADPFELHRRVFASKTWGTGRLLGPVTSTVDSAADGRLAWIVATQEMVDKAEATYGDMDGFADLIRAIKGVELVLFFKEVQEGKVRLSLRSNGNVDAYVIADHFGGGGHKMAAAARLDGPIEEAVKRAVEVCLQMDGIRTPPE